jgi:undecaprenyl diphosphate synthase
MHIGFVMDGNRRWATARNMAKHLGHHQGAEVAKRMVKACADKNIEVMSLWALAKKNILERTPEELWHLFALLTEWVWEIRSACETNNLKFSTIGDLSLLPDHLAQELQELAKSTQNATRMRLVLAVGYGGQDEIVRATRRIIAAGISPESLDETSFAQYLDSGDLSPPDLIIRTGGDMRHSGYFLYQAEYSEYYFTKTLWPDFSESELEAAIAGFASTQRNFGK